MDRRSLVAAVLLFAAAASPAGAHGTARIQQPDGDVKYYKNVRIQIKDRAMAITSADGRGAIILGKAACTRTGALMQCIPYDAILDQYGRQTHIPLKYGMVWLNPTAQPQQLSHSSVRVEPRGVLMTVETKRGTFVSLTGVIDQVQR